MSADPDFWGLNGGVEAARERLRRLQDDARLRDIRFEIRELGT